MKCLNELERVWITSFAYELGRLLKGKKSGGDICSKQVVDVLRQIEKYMGRYPNPRDAAKAMSFTAAINFGRQEAIQRGEGVNHTRVVGQFPTRLLDHGGVQAIDLVDRFAVNPETQAVNRDLCRREISKIKSVVARGLELNAVQGFNQTEAAEIISVTRPYLSRQIKQYEREMRHARKLAA